MRRAELTDAADGALRRLSRDIHLALPNSIQVSGGLIHFIMTSGGGRYRSELEGGDYLSFDDSSDCRTRCELPEEIPVLDDGAVIDPEARQPRRLRRGRGR